MHYCVRGCFLDFDFDFSYFLNVYYLSSLVINCSMDVFLNKSLLSQLVFIC